MKGFFKKKWVKRIITLVVIVAVFAVAGNMAKAPETYRTATVERGDVTVLVSGTGSVSASESRKEISKVAARVEEIYFEEGETVKKGDVIAKLDSSDYEVTVSTQRNSVKQAQISKQNADRQVNNLKIVASSQGYIDGLNISEGSYVVTNTKICDITEPNSYEIELQFIASEINKIEVGNYANIFLTTSYSYIDGTVTYVSQGKKVLENGSNVLDVIITVNNPNYVLGGLPANATITTSSGARLTSAADGKFANSKSEQVLSGSTGTVTKLYVKNGSEVKQGDVIAELENVDLAANAQSSTISLQNMYQQLQYSQDKLEDYAISASIDGTITAQSIKVGDWVSTGNLISTISNMETFEFKIPVDELDISKLSMDSKVSVSIEALPETIDNPIEGKITKLPLEGVVTSGVTDYYVTISIPYVDGLRIAMNASADVIISESPNTLMLPVECVSKENGKYYVEVLHEDEKAKESSIEKREITVGIQNSSFYEVTSGVSEGEKVILPQQNIFGIF